MISLLFHAAMITFDSSALDIIVPFRNSFVAFIVRRYAKSREMLLPWPVQIFFKKSFDRMGIVVHLYKGQANYMEGRL